MPSVLVGVIMRVTIQQEFKIVATTNVCSEIRCGGAGPPTIGVNEDLNASFAELSLITMVNIWYGGYADAIVSECGQEHRSGSGVRDPPRTALATGMSSRID